MIIQLSLYNNCYLNLIHGNKNYIFLHSYIRYLCDKILINNNLITNQYIIYRLSEIYKIFNLINILIFNCNNQLSKLFINNDIWNHLINHKHQDIINIENL